MGRGVVMKEKTRDDKGGTVEDGRYSLFCFL